HFDLATKYLDLAEARHRELVEEGTSSWVEKQGLLVRGYRSEIDRSYQPFGLEIPESLDLTKPVPLLVWLHGRGDKITDLHFLERCATKSQAFGGFVSEQEDAIILHPFGRHCVGWKHAGEIDVFEAIQAVQRDYPIDPDRIALAGFSMGGAGAWHIGAHYRDHFCAVHAGAGFAETKEYLRLEPVDYPVDYEQTLWKVYDVPNYAMNLLNGPLLAYSGGEDKQKQAADLMARVLSEAYGHELRHVIGDGMGHKYNEESVAEIWDWLQQAWKRGRKLSSDPIQWETPTLRYPGYGAFRMKGLVEHWRGAEAQVSREEGSNRWKLKLDGVSAFQLSDAELAGAELVFDDGQRITVADPGFPIGSVSLVWKKDRWQFGEPGAISKRPGLQGPIDDAFLSRFIVVPPSEEPAQPKMARWVDFELAHFRSRWRALMRGEYLERVSEELDSGDLDEANLILWGDPESNPMLAEIVDRLPIEWEEGSFTFRGKRYSAEDKVPVFIFPNPINPRRYVVINSGLTFRENHDRTNSLQNPKLPDWAVVDLTQLPDGEAPGKIEASGFFDENWQ
ncbi:MAG: alpha/beta hydrolase-fold protein, partial [Verrucomicrobiota bacterium]